MPASVKNMQMKLIIARVNCLFLLLGVLALCFCQPVSGFQSRQSPDRIWRILDKNDIAITASQLMTLRQEIPRRFELASLNQQTLRQAITSSTLNAGAANTPPQTSGSVVTLPLPDASFARFLVQEASIMEPALERQFPGFKSYRGQGIDDPTMTVRFDESPDGLHAIILLSGRTYYIDPFPLRAGDRQTHIVFAKDDFRGDEKQIRCLVGEDPDADSNVRRRGSRPLPATNGSVLRTYRLAVAATGEYTKFHGGTVTAAMKAILTTVNRVNAIYESDLAISLKLVGNENKIIYTDPNTDPYTNSNADKLLIENQSNLDKEIGTANYDIGHVFAVGAGGVASLRSVGQVDAKAKGVTGSPKPVGDPFDVDYVAHEMGHQFGANHTFNATTAGCNGNRNPATAYEPGSGSTIMAYAGICGESDLQTNSNSYFHAASLQEIIDYVTSDEIKAVPIITATNNRPPSVVAGQRFIIPKATPFSLRATGTDPDGDPITYSWEQVDLGDASPPDDDVGALRPLFRSFNPARDPVRFFPRLEDLVSNRTSVGETLPVRQRDMNFRITARDNRAGIGAVSFDTALVTVITDSGPFVVTKPVSGTTWTIGSTQEITWNVAGTKDAPISCDNVRISLSVDGGKTFTLLQPVVPNTGTATVTVPNKPTTQGRILVEGVDHAFFNLSQGDLKIVKPGEASRK
jgi:hypothetical protein